MEHNRIVTNDWSNPNSARLYGENWPDEPELREQQQNGVQCGGCSFYAAFNEDWGLCCHSKSRHHLETVFEHFTCAAMADEGWGPHSFSENEGHHCRCQDLFSNRRALTPQEIAAERESYAQYLRNQLKLLGED